MNQGQAHTAHFHLRSALCALWLLLVVLPTSAAAQQPPPALHFTSSAVVSHHVGRLTWDSVPHVRHYQLLRRYPNQDSFRPCRHRQLPSHCSLCRHRWR